MNAGHATGVSQPIGQRRQAGRVPPGKVLSAMPVEYVAVQYGNGDGQIVQEVWLKMNNEYFRAPDAEAFVFGLKPVKLGHSQQVDAILNALAARNDDLPKADAVDVVSHGMATAMKESVDV